MPLIPFPNVPNLPGVPPLPRLSGFLPAVPITPASLAAIQIPALGTIADIPSSASALASLSDLSSASIGPQLSPTFTNGEGLSTGWSILDSSGNAVVSPDSVISFEVSGESKISTYPVEQGGFAAYNKVQTPNRISVKMSCTGNGLMKRDAFLTAFELMKDSVDLYTINTPDQAYQSMSLVHFDYARHASNGAKLILVDAHFEEVQQTASQLGYPAAPSGCDAFNAGNVNPLPMTQAGTSALTGAIPSLPSGVVSVVGQQALLPQPGCATSQLAIQLKAGVT